MDEYQILFLLLIAKILLRSLLIAEIKEDIL
ncbi:hypothetical protein TUMEXPCC7403_23320 [Tumidithrix helvetica PCC 7403]